MQGYTALRNSFFFFFRAAKWQAFVLQLAEKNSSAATHSGLSLCDSDTKWLSISGESAVISSVTVLLSKQNI